MAMEPWLLLHFRLIMRVERFICSTSPAGQNKGDSTTSVGLRTLNVDMRSIAQDEVPVIRRRQWPRVSSSRWHRPGRAPRCWSYASRNGAKKDGRASPAFAPSAQRKMRCRQTSLARWECRRCAFAINTPRRGARTQGKGYGRAGESWSLSVKPRMAQWARRCIYGHRRCRVSARRAGRRSVCLSLQDRRCWCSDRTRFQDRRSRSR